MAYTRRQTQDGVTVMNKDLYDNLQNGIEENRKINNLPDSIINVSSIGADQRAIGTELPVSQAFSGKNWLVTNQCRTIIGHNIETDLYYDLIKIQGKSPNVCKELFNKDIEYKTNRFEPLVVTFLTLLLYLRKVFLEIFSYKYSFNNTN